MPSAGRAASTTTPRETQGSDQVSDTIETPEDVADTIGRTLQFVPREHLIACTNCGLAPMSRAVAEAKLAVLAQGAALADRRLAGR